MVKVPPFPLRNVECYKGYEKVFGILDLYRCNTSDIGIVVYSPFKVIELLRYETSRLLLTHNQICGYTANDNKSNIFN